jgi:beta-lactamase class A
VNRRTAGRALAVAVGALLSFATGWYAHATLHPPGVPPDRRVKLGGFRLSSPLLDVELPEGYDVQHEPIPFKSKVKRFVEEQIRAGRARDVSIYYRDLIDGPWFGVNQGRKYNPASLMKVPVMIAWLKRAERDPGVLQTRLLFEEYRFPARPQTIAPTRTLESGRLYTIDELLHAMIAWSDNRAMWLLYNGLRPEELGDVLDSMDVSNDQVGGENQVTVHGYSGFFRILYNAAYLNREMSEKALELLTLEDFPQGIAAGVPRGVTVAGKFGEAASNTPGEEFQLHEFGIVYHPRGPYILGVMTVGSDPTSQAKVISGISALVYEEIESQALAGRGP